MEKFGKYLEEREKQSQKEKSPRDFFKHDVCGTSQKDGQRDGSSTSKQGEEPHPHRISELEGHVSQLPKGESEYNEVRVKEKMAGELSPEGRVQLENYIGPTQDFGGETSSLKRSEIYVSLQETAELQVVLEKNKLEHIYNQKSLAEKELQDSSKILESIEKIIKNVNNECLIVDDVYDGVNENKNVKRVNEKVKELFTIKNDIISNISNKSELRELRREFINLFNKMNKWIKFLYSYKRKLIDYKENPDKNNIILDKEVEFRHHLTMLQEIEANKEEYAKKIINLIEEMKKLGNGQYILDIINEKSHKINQEEQNIWKKEMRSEIEEIMRTYEMFVEKYLEHINVIETIHKSFESKKGRILAELEDIKSDCQLRAEELNGQIGTLNKEIQAMHREAEEMKKLYSCKQEAQGTASPRSTTSDGESHTSAESPVNACEEPGEAELDSDGAEDLFAQMLEDPRQKPINRLRRTSSENALAQRGQVEKILRDFPSNATEWETLIEKFLRLSKDKYASLDMSEKHFFQSSIQKLEDQIKEIDNKLQANKEQLKKAQEQEKDFHGIPILNDRVRSRTHEILQKSKEKVFEDLVEKIKYIHIMNGRSIDHPKNTTIDGKEKSVTTHEISRKTIGDLLRDSLSEKDKQAVDAADEAYKRAADAETEEGQGDQKWGKAKENKAVAYEKLVAAEREMRDLYKLLIVNELHSKGEQFQSVVEYSQKKAEKSKIRLLKEIKEKNLSLETITSNSEARRELSQVAFWQESLQEGYANALAEMNNCYRKYDEELEKNRKAKELSDKIKDLTDEHKELTCAREAQQKQLQQAKERLAKGVSHSFEETSPTSFRQGAHVQDSPMDQSQDGEMIPAEIEKAKDVLKQIKKQKKAISVVMDKASQELHDLKFVRKEVESLNSILKESAKFDKYKLYQEEKDIIEMKKDLTEKEKEGSLVKKQLENVYNEIIQLENNLEKENMQHEELKRTIKIVQEQCKLLEQKRIVVEKNDLSQFKGKIDEQINELVLLQESIKKIECEKEDSNATIDKFFEQKNALAQVLGQAIETRQDLPRLLRNNHEDDIEALKNDYFNRKIRFIEKKNKVCEKEAKKAYESIKKVDREINKYEKNIEEIKHKHELLIKKRDSLSKLQNDVISDKVKLQSIKEKHERMKERINENFNQRDFYDQACEPKLVERSRLVNQLKESIEQYEAAIATGRIFLHMAERLRESNQKEYFEKKDIILKEIIHKENEEKGKKNNLQLKANSIGREIAKKKKELSLKQKQKRSLEEKLHTILLEKEQLSKEIENREKELCDHIKRHERDREQSEVQAMELKKKIADLAGERIVQIYSLILPEVVS